MSKASANRINGVYVITDSKLHAGREHVEITEAAISGGATVVQLREKEASDGEMLQIASEIRRLTIEAGILFVVNNRLDIALACGADGVHVGQDDLPISVVRAIVGQDMIVGISAATVAEALGAESAGADYVGFGPVFATATKEDAAESTGLDALSRVTRVSNIPIVAIGGISQSNIASIATAGAHSASVISAVVTAPDMVEAVRKLKTEFERGRQQV